MTVNSKILFCVLQAIPGYGARIFIQKSIRGTSIEDFLKAASCWGGADKELKNYTSYEIPTSYDLNTIEAILIRMGCEKHEHEILEGEW